MSEIVRCPKCQAWMLELEGTRICRVSRHAKLDVSLGAAPISFDTHAGPIPAEGGARYQVRHGDARHLPPGWDETAAPGWSYFMACGKCGNARGWITHEA